MNQPTLFDPIVVPEQTDTTLTIQQRFEQFCDVNPHVEAHLVRLGRQLLAQGRRRFSLTLLYEVLRWEYAIHTTGDLFKLNDHYKSRYARRITQRYPEFKGVFELRRLVAP